MTEYGYVGGGTRQKTNGEDCTRCTHNKRGPGVLSGLPIGGEDCDNVVHNKRGKVTDWSSLAIYFLYHIS